MFKIVIAYDNIDAATRAQEMAGRLAARLDFVCDTWPFELLACERVRESAAIVAAAADMVIIAADGRNELPDSVKDWIESWLAQRNSDPSVLVGLLYEEAASGKTLQSCAYLQEAAGRGNMDFFCCVGRWWLQNAPQRKTVSAGDHLSQPSYVDSDGENHPELAEVGEGTTVSSAAAG